MLHLQITIEGKSITDLELAIDEAKKRISKGNREGFDSNEDGEFSFEVSGKEEPSDND